MIDRRPRSSYESDWLPYTKETARRAVRVAIGQALIACFETPQELSPEIRMLLAQVNARTRMNNEPQFALLAGGKGCAEGDLLGCAERAPRT